MAVQNHLWELVKKLDQKEVERFLRKHGASNSSKKPAQTEAVKDYVLLFNDLLLESEYEEREFKRKNAGKPYLNSLPQMKRYLYDAILDFLREPKKSGVKDVQPEFLIREWLEEATILRQRLLLAQCLARLEKAESEARRGEFLELLLEVLKRKRTHINEATGKNYRTEFPIVLEEIRKVGAQIALNSRLIACRDAFVYAAKIKAKRKEPDHPSIVHALEEIKELASVENMSLEAEINFHTAIAMKAHWENDAMQAWKSYTQVYQLWNEHPEFQHPRRGQYLKMLNNYLSCGIVAKQDTDFFRVIAELNKTGEMNPDDAAEAKQNVVYLQLHYYMAFCDWDNCKALEEEYKRGETWVTKKMKKPRRVAFHLSFARFHFVFGRVDQAREYLQQVLSEEEGKAAPDRDAEARVMEFLMAWDEAGKNTKGDHESLLHNIKSYLKRNKSETPFYTALLKSLTSVLKAVPFKQKSTYQEAEKTLNGLLESLSFDSSQPLFIAWVKSKASGVPIYEFLGK